MKLKFGDFIIVLLILAGAFTLSAGLFNLKQHASKAIVEIDGKEVETFELSENDDSIKTVESGPVHFKVHLKGGKIAITEIDCPDKVCVKTGYIGGSGQTIVCIPNKVIIKAISDSTNGEVDIVAK